MVEGWFPRASTFPQQAVPFEDGKAVSSSSDSHFQTVQEAIDATDSGGAVIVGAGTFTENVTISSTKNNIVVAGTGRSTLIDGGTGGAAILVDGADSVTIRDLAVQTTAGGGSSGEGVEVSGAVDNITIDRVTVEESDDLGIQFASTVTGQRNQIVNCRVINTDGHGVFVQAGTVDVLGTTVFGAGTNGIETQSADCKIQDCRVFDQTQARGIRVRGNNTIIEGCRVDGSGTDGIQADGNDCEIADCRVTGAWGDGIQLAGDSTLVTGNSITGMNDLAVDYGTSTNAHVEGNEPRSVNNEWVRRLVDSPNVTIEEQSIGSAAETRVTIQVANGETLKVYRWGAYQTSDGAAVTDLDVELQDGADTVQATANTADNESTDPATPVASHTNSSGSTSLFKLAIANDTAGAITAGGFFAYAVN